MNSSDDALIYQITHRRNKFLPSGYVAPNTGQASNLWNYTYSEFGQQQAGKLYQFQETSFRKGDLLSFCIDTGRVTPKMLNVQAQEIWQFNQAMNSTNPPTPNPDIYEGTTAYLLGMSYFNYYDNFEAFSSHLHKIQPVTSFAYGFGVLRPQRDTSGNLVSNGVVNLITPAVHIREDGVGLIFNGTLHPNSAIDYPTAYYDWFIQDNLQGSAAEHGVLRGFYQTNAISTVKLLQQVGTNMLILTADNYFTAATNVYGGVQLQNADPSLWQEVTSLFASSDPEEIAFLTPGAVTSGTYSGMGGLLLSHNLFLAEVGGLNGGVANNLPTSTFSSGNAANDTVEPAPDGSTSPYTFQSSSPVNNSADPVDGATTANALPTTAANLPSRFLR